MYKQSYSSVTGNELNLNSLYIIYYLNVNKKHCAQTVSYMFLIILYLNPKFFRINILVSFVLMTDQCCQN